MKNLKKVMFLSFAVFALVLSSCSSDNSSDDSDSPESQEGFMKFKYNEKDYTFSEPAIITSGSVNIMGSSGIDNTYKKISLWTPLDIKTGSHPIVYDLSNLTTTYQASFSFMPEIENVNATSGTLNIITNDDKKIEGTFSFSGTSNGKTFTVTEGSFRFVKF
ncbi:hypothetical protein [Flavobacterium sp.]|uniref:hypothetical protein n=1 Tax=Flavobacterium sp. TaxID=239 RepID=UPI0031D5E56A